MKILNRSKETTLDKINRLLSEAKAAEAIAEAAAQKMDAASLAIGNGEPGAEKAWAEAKAEMIKADDVVSQKQAAIVQLRKINAAELADEEKAQQKKNEAENDAIIDELIQLAGNQEQLINSIYEIGEKISDAATRLYIQLPPSAKKEVPYLESPLAPLKIETNMRWSFRRAGFMWAQKWTGERENLPYLSKHLKDTKAWIHKFRKEV